MARFNLLRRVRWSWTLSLIASTVTAVLIVVAARDDAAFLAAHRGISAGEFQSPASLFAQALNGPVFFYPHPSGLLDAGWIRLPGVVLFWAWLGRGIDRRLRGGSTTSKSPNVRLIVINSVMLCTAVLFTFEFSRLLHKQTLLPFDHGFSSLMWQAPWNVTLRLTALGWYVGLAWSAAYVFYFAVKLLRAWTTGKPKQNLGKSQLTC